MYNKFKDGDSVIVNGIGKCNDKRYKDKIEKLFAVIHSFLITIFDLKMVQKIGLMTYT